MNSIRDIQNRALLYSKFYAEKQSEIYSDTTLRRTDKEIKLAYSAVIDSAFKVFESIKTEKIITWLTPLIYLENNKNTTYVSLPITLRKDLTTLSVNIEPKKPEFGLQNYKAELSFPIQKRRYIGTGVSFYVSSLYSEAFSIQATKLDTVNTDYKLISEEPLKAEIGLSTLLYFGKKFYNSDWGGHFLIGPSLSLSTKVKPRLSIGAGISYGKKQMVTLGIIGMGGYVDKRSVVYEENKTYKVKPNQITVSKLDFGYGLSMGYIYKF
jgi:hypothetical protein